MSIKDKCKAAGITLVLAPLIAAALLATLGSDRFAGPPGNAPVEQRPKGPLSPAIVAPAVQLGRAYAAVAAHIKPAVVSVYSIRLLIAPPPRSGLPSSAKQPQERRPHPQRPYTVPQVSLGSGMILDRHGYILTNYHVVKGFTTIRVQLADRRTLPAEVIGTDPRTDVAVIRIKSPVPRDLSTVQFGDSRTTQDGDLVLAVGAPFGLVESVTNGIVSATGRADLSDYEDFLQTDAPINPGSSGGPLVNMQGQVIGMNTAILTGATATDGQGQFGGVGFAIPIDRIKAILPTLLRGGHIVRGMIGVIMPEGMNEVTIPLKLPDIPGALVTQVSPGSPAQQAGIRSGDKIVRFDGQPIRDSRDLRYRVAASTPGTRVPLEIVRKGRAQSVTVVIGTLSEDTR